MKGTFLSSDPSASLPAQPCASPHTQKAREFKQPKQAKIQREKKKIVVFKIALHVPTRSSVNTKGGMGANI